MKVPSSITTILFDLDNTLIDRDSATSAGLREWLKSQGTVEKRNMDAEMKIILEKDDSGYTDRELFCKWLSGHYANDETKRKTPQELLRELQEPAISHLQPNEELLALLERLQSKYNVVLATNGSSSVQQKKIAKTKLDRLFLPKQIFISEQIGCAKPERGFFDHILTAVNQSPDQCLMVGDNYINDIESAATYGLSTCWIDHKGSSQSNQADFIFKNSIETATWLLS